MKGGGKCKLCGSQGTLSSTCPLNPKAKKPNPNKHPNAKKELLLLSSSTKSSSNKSLKKSSNKSSSERKRMKSFMDGLPSAKSSTKSSSSNKSSNLHYYLVHKETGKTYDIRLDDMSVILVLGDGSKQPKATFRSRAKAIEYIEEQVERMTKLGYEIVSGKKSSKTSKTLKSLTRTLTLPSNKSLTKTLTLPSNKSLTKTITYVDTSEIPDQNCSKYKKFKAPKCTDQQSCEWVKKEGKKPGHCKKKFDSKKSSSNKSSSNKSTSKKSSSKKSSSKKSFMKKSSSKKQSPGIDYFISTLFKILKEKNCYIFKVDGVHHEVSEDELHKKIEENMKEIYDYGIILKTINQFLNAWNKCVEDSEWSIRDRDEGNDGEMDAEVFGELEDRYMKDFPEAYAAEGRGYPSESESE